jgi:hypothetical protein
MMYVEVLRNKLCDKMRNSRYPELLTTTTEGMYEDMTVCIGTGQSLISGSEMTNQCVGQGCAVPPPLFNAYILMQPPMIGRLGNIT